VLFRRLRSYIWDAFAAEQVETTSEDFPDYNRYLAPSLQVRLFRNLEYGEEIRVTACNAPAPQKE
jgi:hypothetical protein